LVDSDASTVRRHVGDRRRRPRRAVEAEARVRGAGGRDVVDDVDRRGRLDGSFLQDDRIAMKKYCIIHGQP
ncbi:hypothetical protein ACHAWF_016407, partial [Thalassiosira exigua]